MTNLLKKIAQTLTQQSTEAHNETISLLAIFRVRRKSTKYLTIQEKSDHSFSYSQ